MKTQCVSIVWLVKANLSNLNSGEGGGGNVVELKTYRNGKRPYLSGQSVRHALREALERGNPGCFISTPEAPSCDIKEDWLCDLFGYLSPRKGEGSNRRWSPIKCTPALGQQDAEIVTDLLLRMSDLEKEGKSDVRDQRLAYVQLAETIYRIGMNIDLFAVGRRLIVKGDAKEKKITRREFVDEIGEAERIKRVRAVILSLAQLGDFAKQARNATSMSPDIFLGCLLPIYTQRGLRSLELDDSGSIPISTFETIASDIRSLGGKLYVGYTPGVAQNDTEFLSACKQLQIHAGHPVETLKMMADEVD